MDKRQPKNSTARFEVVSKDGTDRTVAPTVDPSALISIHFSSAVTKVDASTLRWAQKMALLNDPALIVTELSADDIANEDADAIDRTVRAESPYTGMHV